MGSVEANVVEHRLDNGMKVIVKQDRRAPIAVSQVWYKVGSSYESGGITGISHVLEHMMFKGTKNHPPGEFSRIIAANGGDENAFTGRDYTAYFQTMASDRLEVSFELEADRMRNLLLLDAEFAKEVEVVKEERRMRTEDKPQSLTYERFVAGAYESSPYRTPVIGWMADLDALEVDDLKVWYRKWYAPNNATLVVVGDVEPERVIQL
ncbi:MAG: insulinase family protein, partial [gamma proteobacterium symbiont of Ctena orbiculata]